MAMIRQCRESDFDTLCEIINDAARAYRGIIPADRWHDPYMPPAELRREIDDGIAFWCSKRKEGLCGIMGIQDRKEVTLIRHAYVRSASQRQGVGTGLLEHLEAMTDKTILIGTWRAASWAISFYEKRGYSLTDKTDTVRLLRRYWSIPERQVETSVVLMKVTGA